MRATSGILCLAALRTFVEVAWALHISHALSQRSTCSPSSPCEQGCCSEFGSCGFGPDFCGEGCQGTCDAKAECGEFALPENEFCPLGVCCSPWGFCGTTAEFCESGCQSGCGVPSRPSCGGGSGTSDAKTIGYYESWAHQRPGCSWDPEDLQVRFLTHINYAFALIGDDYRIAAMNQYDHVLYQRVIALKERNPALKVSIAIGGWAVSSPPFSNMARTAERRATFIQSVLDFMNTYGFDGVDLDWEYPVATDRDGHPDDKANYVHLVQELREALGTGAEISVAIPASYWYLQNFDLAGMAPHVNWFNVMSYDIHGTWDGNSKWTESVVQPHTNLTEIDTALDLLWRSGIGPEQVVLGLAFYGRSFTLANPSCTSPMCPFEGGAELGSCTQESGVLSNAEIRDVLDRTGITPQFDSAAGVKWFSWEGQWVSYDDGETLEIKKQFANNRCLGGTMIWALDLDEPGSPTLHALANAKAHNNIGDLLGDDFPMPIRLGAVVDEKIREQDEVALTVVLTDCSQNPICPPGFKWITAASGSWSYMDQSIPTCPSLRNPARSRYDEFIINKRALCIEDNIEAESCAWVGTPLFCNGFSFLPGLLGILPWPGTPGGCPAGSMLLAQNNEPPVKGQIFPQQCFPGTMSSYCCKKVRTTNKYRPCDDIDQGSMMLSGGAAGALYADRLPGWQRRRMGELQERYGGSGSSDNYGDVAICNRKRGLPAVAAVFLIVAVLIGNSLKPQLAVGGGGHDCTDTTTIHTTSTTSVTATRNCDANQYPQACAHYKSVASHMWQNGLNPAAQQDHLLCPSVSPVARRWIPGRWSNEHKGWVDWVPKLAGSPGNNRNCERDEFPFHRFTGNPGVLITNQYLRLLPGSQNGGAGQLANGICPDVMKSSVETLLIRSDGSRNCYETISTTKTQTALSISYINWNNAWDGGSFPYLVKENPCLPQINFDDAGFAMITGDPWYWTGPGAPGPPFNYKVAPPQHVTQGYTKPTRRMVDGEIRFLPDDGFGVVDDRNSSRRATREELLEHLGIIPCMSSGCVDEMAALGLDVEWTSPAQAEASVTTAAILPKESGGSMVGETGHGEDSTSPRRELVPRQAQMAEATSAAGKADAPEPTQGPKM